MSQKMGGLEVTICLGSSCFARGNNSALKLLQEYIETRGLKNQVKLKGCLCEGACNSGPHITIDGKRYGNVNPQTAIDLLAFHLRQNQR